MSNYRRARQPGGTFFFTVVTYQRQPILASKDAIASLRAAMAYVKSKRPFKIDAIVILPDHLHAIWTLPANDDDFSTRWRLIKYRFSLTFNRPSAVRQSQRDKREKGIWQRRFWEHTIRDENDLHRHTDYIHYNPVKHGLAAKPADWPFSSFAREVRRGRYPEDWGADAAPTGLGDMNVE